LVPPKGGSVLDEPVGRYPTVFTNPGNGVKPLTPVEGVTVETPAMETPPFRAGRGS
jgi:hypothetical protein